VPASSEKPTIGGFLAPAAVRGLRIFAQNYFDPAIRDHGGIPAFLRGFATHCIIAVRLEAHQYAATIRRWYRCEAGAEYHF